METVLITGCSSGIGAATARKFVEEGWTVYATARDPDDLEALAEVGCETAPLDVTEPEQIQTVVDRMIDETGRIDALVNNAGYATYGALEDVPIADVHRLFDVNVCGPHRLIQAVLSHMREQGDGTIVNVSSVGGRLAYPLGSTYCGSKFALEGLSDALRAEVKSQGIDVVVIEPGFVETGFLTRVDEEAVPQAKRTQAYEKFYRAIEDATLLGFNGPLADDPEDVAKAILNAASCTDPAPRYAVGTFARVLSLARFLPSQVRDAGFQLLARIAR